MGGKGKRATGMVSELRQVALLQDRSLDDMIFIFLVLLVLNNNNGSYVNETLRLGGIEKSGIQI